MPTISALTAPASLPRRTNATVADSSSSNLLDWVLLLLPGLIWGTSYLFIAEGLEALAPDGVTFARFVFGFLTLSLVQITTMNPLPAIESALRRCTAPVRMVWRTADPFFDVSWAEWLDKTFPESQGIRRIERAKVFFSEEMPEEVGREARALWRVPLHA